MSELAVTLDAPDSARAGEAVVFAVVLANESDSTVSVHFQGREIIFNVTVADLSGRTVWNSLGDAFAQAILRLDTFAPREIRRLECEWDQRDPAGTLVERRRYVAQAQVPTESGVLTTAPRLLILD